MSETETQIPEENPWLGTKDKQPLIWLAMFIFHFAMEWSAAPSTAVVELFSESFCFVGLGVVYCSLLFVLYAKTRPEQAPKWQAFSLSTLAFLFALLCWMLSYYLVETYIVQFKSDYLPFSKWTIQHTYDESVHQLLLLLSWHGFSVTQIKAYELHREQVIQLQTQRALEQANLAHLRQQINPHFLFNSLNSIVALITEHPTKAQDMLIQLSQFLRQVLEDGMADVISLEDELHFIRLYMDIVHMRFEENIEYKESIEIKDTSIKVPSLILQPLIENAIKHGMLTSTMPLQVELHITQQQHTYTFQIRNTGRLTQQKKAAPKGAKQKQGHGLDIIKRRLHLNYRGASTFSLEQEQDWVVATIRLDVQKDR